MKKKFLNLSLFSAFAVACLGGCDRHESFSQVSNAVQVQSAVCVTPHVDENFGVKGTRPFSFPSGAASGRVVRLQSDGKLVIAGLSVISSTQSSLAILRLTADGMPDLSFGPTGDGSVQTKVGSLRDEIFSLAIQPNGKIVTVGRTEITTNHSRVVVARYEANGLLDSTFGSAGIVTTAWLSGDSQATGVAIDGAGNILVTGPTNNLNSPYRFGLARYLANGLLDTSFGINGIVTTSVDPTGGDSIGTGLSLQVDGKIIIGGTSYHNAAGEAMQVGAVARYLADGSLDGSFAGTGMKILSALSLGGKTLVDPKGRILIAGSTATSVGHYIPGILRLRTDGSIDTSFGAAGVASSEAGEGTGVNIFTDFAFQGDRIVGVAFFTRDSMAHVLRYTDAGLPDTCFGNWQSTSVGGGSDWNQSVAIQTDGSIIVGGHGLSGSNLIFSSTRLTR